MPNSSEERSIYATIAEPFGKLMRDRPNDLDTRLVYADWLEQRGEVGKARYVRIRAQMMSLLPWVEVLSLMWQKRRR